MVSPQRAKEKLNRLESKIMAYNELLASGVIPEFNDVLNFAESRRGKEALGIERARAYQAMWDLKVDIQRNLVKLGITEADHLKTVAADFREVYESIKAPTEKKKGGKKDAEA